MPRRPTAADDPAILYRVFAHNGESDALAKTLSYVLGLETEDHEAVIDAVRAAVQRARIPDAELEELRTRLQLCNLAALTGTDVADIPRHAPEWSEAYENTKALHTKYRAIAELHDSLPWPIITAYEFWAAVKKELTSR